MGFSDFPWDFPCSYWVTHGLPRFDVRNRESRLVTSENLHATISVMFLGRLVFLNRCEWPSNGQWCHVEFTWVCWSCVFSARQVHASFLSSCWQQKCVFYFHSCGVDVGTLNWNAWLCVDHFIEYTASLTWDSIFLHWDLLYTHHFVWEEQPFPFSSFCPRSQSIVLGREQLASNRDIQEETGALVDAKFGAWAVSWTGGSDAAQSSQVTWQVMLRIFAHLGVMRYEMYWHVTLW